MGDSGLGLEAQGFVVMVDGLKILSLFGQYESEIVVGQITIGVDRQSVFKKKSGCYASMAPATCCGSITVPTQPHRR